jgi:hypothetical protein
MSKKTAERDRYIQGVIYDILIDTLVHENNNLGELEAAMHEQILDKASLLMSKIQKWGVAKFMQNLQQEMEKV